VARALASPRQPNNLERLMTRKLANRERRGSLNAFTLQTRDPRRVCSVVKMQDESVITRINRASSKHSMRGHYLVPHEVGFAKPTEQDENNPYRRFAMTMGTCFSVPP
jgi:hypothetical protein